MTALNPGRGFRRTILTGGLSFTLTLLAFCLVANFVTASELDQQGNSGNEQNQAQQPQSDKNATAQQRGRSGEREQDRQDPGIKNRQEAEALLDSLKDDEHRVSSRALNGNTEPPPTLSGKDW